MTRQFRLLACLLCLALFSLLLPPHSLRAAPPLDSQLRVQAFLDAQPGPLKTYLDGRQSAAAIIESASLYYGLDARLHLTLLETTAALLSDPQPPAVALSQPFGVAGPNGFALQIEWASRELRAGLGPYTSPPVLRFSDGTTVTLSLQQAPEGVAVQRFLAQGRTQNEWRALAIRFNQLFAQYFNNELPEAAAPEPVATQGFLLLPWPAGTPVQHLAYFDHAYPTVDSGADGNREVVTYLGPRTVQYNTHDGHDYVFPLQPIGSPILAAAGGVAYARTVRGNGVLIRHASGYETVYWHLDTFAPLFAGLVDSSQGVQVAAGELLGTSGRSGFVAGTPHLHFEVRHNGRQVDPYGWFGSGEDPCAAYAGCEASTWLWHDSLRGSYDFTPPNSAAPDRVPPVGTLTLNPRPDLLLLARFDDSVVPEVAGNQPLADGIPVFDAGRFDQGLRVGPAALTFPVSGSLSLAAGTLSLWAQLPDAYPQTSTGRHYLLAASANPEDSAKVYSGTLALRRQQEATGAHWSFWTVGDAGGEDALTAPDTLGPGWHHVALSWDAASGSKALYLDGQLVAQRTGIVLPSDVGALLQLGRFTFGSVALTGTLDELAIFNRVLPPEEIRALAQAEQPFAASDARLVGQQGVASTVRLDTNALDGEGGIMALSVALDGLWGDPIPYAETLELALPPREGLHTVAARYADGAGNSSVVSASITLDLPPVASAYVLDNDGLRATLAISASDGLPGVLMQVSPLPDFVGASWLPVTDQVEWNWGPVVRRVLYLRFRDSNGLVSEPLLVGPDTTRIWLPLIANPAGS